MIWKRHRARGQLSSKLLHRAVQRVASTASTRSARASRSAPGLATAIDGLGGCCGCLGRIACGLGRSIAREERGRPSKADKGKDGGDAIERKDSIGRHSVLSRGALESG